MRRYRERGWRVRSNIKAKLYDPPTETSSSFRLPDKPNIVVKYMFSFWPFLVPSTDYNMVLKWLKDKVVSSINAMM